MRFYHIQIHLLLTQLVQIIISKNLVTTLLTEKFDPLNQEYKQTLNIGDSLQMKSFTPIQLLVALKHKQALTLLAEKELLNWNAEIYSNMSHSQESKQEDRSAFTLLDIAKQ